MLRIPTHDIIAQGFRHFTGRTSSLGKEDAALDAISLRDAAMRGIMSAALILIVLILFLL